MPKARTPKGNGMEIKQGNKARNKSGLTETKEIETQAVNDKPDTKKMIQLDPLFVIFEQHLLNFQDPDSSRKQFLEGIVQEYLRYLRGKQIALPKHLEPYIVDELTMQVNVLLLKRIYGCLSISDYRNQLPADSKKIAKKTAKQKYALLFKKKSG